MRPAVLAYRTLGLGDLLTAVPALRGLRRALPHHRLDLATQGWLAPIVELIDVDRLLATPELGPVHGTYEVAVNLHGRGTESRNVVAATRPERLISFAGGGVPWLPAEHEVERWCRLLGEHGIACDPADLELTVPDSPVPRGVSVVHIGAKHPARRWPAERFARIARRLPNVVVTGGPQERGRAERVATEAGIDRGRVLAGRTDLRQFAALIGHAHCVVSGDTGAQHLATAFRTPSIVLFGPVAPGAWGPPPDREEHISLWAGHRGDPHGRTTDDGLLQIGVDDVLDAYRSLVDRGVLSDRRSLSP